MKKTARIVVTPEQVCSELEGEAVILFPKSGQYYGLNEVGTRVWRLIQEPRTVNEIRDALLAEYDVQPERVEADLLHLLEILKSKGLIEIDDAAAAT